MTYVQFRDSIARELLRTKAGMTWAQLQAKLKLPYDRPCPNWTGRLEKEIALQRVKGDGRALVWKIRN